MKHIEELPKDRMLHIIRNLPYMRVTEKVDGSNLVFGFDEDGKLYTSRMNKGKSERYYSVDDYEDSPINNGFKAAHAALEAAVADDPIPGTFYEIEVLYGIQPNAIVYGSNRIVFIDEFPYEPDDEIIVTTNKIMSDDGVSTFSKNTTSTWKFNQVPEIKLPHYGIDMDDCTKEEIKPVLVNKILRHIKPAFRDVPVEPHQDFGVEGIVIEDPETGEVVKLVDKHTFTLINQFNFAIRNELKATGPRFNPANNSHLYQSFTATVGYQQISIFDTMLSELASLMGISGLGKYMTITRTLKKYDDVQDFLDNWAAYDISTTRAAFDYAITTAINRMEIARTAFMKQWTTYELVLTSGQSIRYTDETYKRTLVVFAENLRELHEIRYKIEEADDWRALAEAIYGKQMQLAFPNQ